MKIFKLLVCLIALSAVPNLRAQQITGSMHGTVTNPSGAVVEGATVTARQNETGLSRITTTDHAGTYLLLELPVGHYQLQVERTGFQSYIQQGISLDVNESAIEFHTQPALLDRIPHPYPAGQHVPEWLKEMPQDFEHGGTLKRCPPFLAAMTAGYIIPAPAGGRLPAPLRN